mmetsp:Transcript_27939/g.91587  ORF Transcript_27939/g.91587 Transcript_27939/m.91587 type:complete len:394 (+) Transcript_27939:180-1361(+)
MREAGGVKLSGVQKARVEAPLEPVRRQGGVAGQPLLQVLPQHPQQAPHHTRRLGARAEVGLLRRVCGAIPQPTEAGRPHLLEPQAVGGVGARAVGRDMRAESSLGAPSITRLAEAVLLADRRRCLEGEPPPARRHPERAKLRVGRDGVDDPHVGARPHATAASRRQQQRVHVDAVGRCGTERGQADQPGEGRPDVERARHLPHHAARGDAARPVHEEGRPEGAVVHGAFAHLRVRAEHLAVVRVDHRQRRVTNPQGEGGQLAERLVDQRHHPEVVCHDVAVAAALPEGAIVRRVQLLPRTDLHGGERLPRWPQRRLRPPRRRRSEGRRRSGEGGVRLVGVGEGEDEEEPPLARAARATPPRVEERLLDQPARPPRRRTRVVVRSGALAAGHVH